MLGSVNAPGVTGPELEEVRKLAQNALDLANAAVERAGGAAQAVEALTETVSANNAAFDARLSLLELTYAIEVTGNPYTVTFDSLDGLEAAGVWNTAQKRLEF